MTHKEAIIKAFRQHGNRMTLGYILQNTWGYKFTSRASDLRKDGYVVIFEKGRTPSDNIYTLIEPDQGGQMRFA